MVSLVHEERLANLAITRESQVRLYKGLSVRLRGDASAQHVINCFHAALLKGLL